MTALAYLIVGIAILLALSGVAVWGGRLWRAFRQEAWIIKTRGARELVRRAEQPRRLWFWTAVETAIFTLTAATVPILAWVIAQLGHSN